MDPGLDHVAKVLGLTREESRSLVSNYGVRSVEDLQDKFRRDTDTVAATTTTTIVSASVHARLFHASQLLTIQRGGEGATASSEKKHLRQRLKRKKAQDNVDDEDDVEGGGSFRFSLTRDFSRETFRRYVDALEGSSLFRECVQVAAAKKAAAATSRRKERGQLQQQQQQQLVPPPTEEEKLSTPSSPDDSDSAKTRQERWRRLRRKRKREAYVLRDDSSTSEEEEEEDDSDAWSPTSSTGTANIGDNAPSAHEEGGDAGKEEGRDGEEESADGLCDTCSEDDDGEGGGGGDGEGGEVSRTRNPGFDTTGKNGYSNDKDEEGNGGGDSHYDDCDDDDDDDDDMDPVNDDQVKRERGRLLKSSLHLAIQGFRRKYRREEEDGEYSDDERDEEEEADDELHRAGTEPAATETVVVNGKSFSQGRCYYFEREIVGILRFLPRKATEKTRAGCVLVVPFEDTFLGMHGFVRDDDAGGGGGESLISDYVQVKKKIPPLPLAEFGAEASELAEIPVLEYEPQSPGSMQNFAYSSTSLHGKRRGPRSAIKTLELCAGAGGFREGLKRATGFKVTAVEKDVVAAQTYGENHERPFVMDVKEFLELCKTNSAFRDYVYAHMSPPCCGFSGMNRTGGRDDEANNVISLLFVEYMKVHRRAIIGSFENVTGMWRDKNIRYLVQILGDLVNAGFQVRCCVLKACDYGDPQKRPRIFVFAARPFVVLPGIPKPTHGPAGLARYVTAGEALCELERHRGSHDLPNMAGKTSRAADRRYLKRDAPAAAVGAKCVPLMHYNRDLDRCITVREAATLQSFPYAYPFRGSINDQYKQVGNAVPVRLATAVAREIEGSLLYCYEEEEKEESDNDDENTDKR